MGGEKTWEEKGAKDRLKDCKGISLFIKQINVETRYIEILVTRHIPVCVIRINVLQCICPSFSATCSTGFHSPIDKAS